MESLSDLVQECRNQTTVIENINTRYHSEMQLFCYSRNGSLDMNKKGRIESSITYFTFDWLYHSIFSKLHHDKVIERHNMLFVCCIFLWKSIVNVRKKDTILQILLLIQGILSPTYNKPKKSMNDALCTMMKFNDSKIKNNKILTIM